MRDILHIDMNAYFATVEELLDPRLVGKPVIVGGRVKRSVVSSANYIARAKGVKAAMPVFQAEKLCPEGIYVFPHFRAYEEYHMKFIQYIEKNFTNKIEVASIDECYIDITDLTNKHTPFEIAKTIQLNLKKKFGLGTSIGIAHNKFMAKMGSDYKKPNGITQMYDEDVETKL
jgi:DNA polymerase-4